MIRHCLLEGHLDASQEELLVGSGREQGSRRLRVRKLEVRLKVHVIALEGKHCPCRHLRSSVRAYFDLIEWERKQQDDPDVIPLVKITFRESK